MGFNWQRVTMIQIAACIAFLWAWKHQFIHHKIFAKLKKQLILSGSKSVHSIPHGDWFHYVSCPHYLAEILMYASLSIILSANHKTGIVVFLWVLINQTIVLLSNSRLKNGHWIISILEMMPNDSQEHPRYPGSGRIDFVPHGDRTVCRGCKGGSQYVEGDSNVLILQDVPQCFY